MHRARLHTVHLVVLLASIWPQVSDAVDVHRCRDEHRRLVLSDRPCAALGLEPVPPPDSAAAEVDDADANPPPTREATPPPVPEAALGCPGPHAEALAEAVVEAAASADLNALAAMFHWPAAGRGASARVFALAQRLADQAPLAWEIVPERSDDAWLWAGQPPPARPRRLPPMLLLRRAGDDPASPPLARFSLVRYAGCFWLEP